MYTNFTDIALLSDPNDDVTDYVTHRIFNINVVFEVL